MALDQRHGPSQATARSRQHAHDAGQQLLRLVGRLPIPTAPPVYTSSGASIGLYLLDLGLNFNHVSRVTESLVMTEHDHVARTVEIDLSLDLLTPDQFATGLDYAILRNASADPGGSEPVRSRPGLIWIPITRVERSHVAPVELYDNEGRQVPRATQPEILALVNAALYRTFKQLMEARPPDDDLDAFLRRGNRARWLVEDAIARLVYGGDHSLDLRPPLPAAVGSTAPAARPTSSGSIRDLAALVIDTALADPAGVAFLDLLHTVSHEYLIVAGLDSSKREHTLRHEMPRLPIQRDDSASNLRRSLRNAVSLGREFQVRYTTPVARGVSSFHISVEAETEVCIRRAFLMTNRDQHFVDILHNDLGYLRDSLRESEKGIAKYREYEMQYAFGLLHSIMQRRLRELESAPLDPVDQTTRPRLVWLADVCAQFAAGDLTRLATYSAERIDEVIAAIDELGLGTDATFDDDPREDAAHVYWRQGDPLEDHQGRRQPCEATLSLSFVDDPPSLAQGVVVRLIALLGTVLGIGVLLLDGVTWLNPWSPVAPIEQSLQADALIAVLLIVPSLLVARLDLPSHRSLLGQLRVLGRVCAYAGLVLTAGLAIVVATSTNDAGLLRAAFLGVSLGLVVLIGVLMLDRAVARRKARSYRLRAMGAPKWLWEPWGRYRGEVPDAVFESFTGIGRNV